MKCFVDFLNGTANGFCYHALWMFVQVTVLVGIVWGLDLLLRRQVRASVRYCIWLLVLLKLVLPVDLRLPSGVGYWLNLEERTPAPIREAILTRPVAIEETIVPPVPPAAALNTNISEAGTRNGQPFVQSAPAMSSLTFQGLLFLGWLVGVFCLLVVLGVQFALIRNVIRRSKGVSVEISEMLEQCQSALRMSGTIAVRESADVGSPAVCGVIRPIILIPSGLVRRLSDEQLETVLLHELMHIKRYDLWVNVVQNCLQVFYFYNPFIRFANGRIRTAREQANDEQVLVHLKGRREDYSATLIEIAAAAVGRPMLAVRLVGVAEPKTHLHERITLMMQKPIPKTARLGLWGTLSLLLLGLVLLPMGGRLSAAAEAGSKVPTLTQEQFLAQCKTIIGKFITGNNNGDAAAAASIYARDGAQLPPTDKAAIGTEAISELLMKDINSGVRILSANGVVSDVWYSGPYLFAIQRSTAAVRVPQMQYLQLVTMKSLNVTEVQPDGTMLVKVDAWNLDQTPGAETLAEGVAVSAEKDAFHTAQSNPKAANATPETIEKIKQLSTEFHKVCIDGDAAAIASYYADNAIYLATGPAGTMRGRQQILDTIAPSRLQYRAESIGDQILMAGGTEEMVYVVNSFLWKIRDVAKPDELLTIPGKGVHVWQKQADGSWKILVDINSPNPQ